MAVVVYLALIPLGFLLWQSFFTLQTAAKPAEFTLQKLAWMNERTNTPFKTLFFGLSLIPLIIPGALMQVA